MSDMLSRINDDIEEYEELCRHFNEKPKMKTWVAHGRTHTGVDVYGSHAQALRNRRDKELKEEK